MDAEHQELAGELMDLARQIEACPDDVADLAAVIVSLYRHKRMVVLGLLGVNAMIAGDEREIDEGHPKLVATRVWLRDRLQTLVAWARESGRL